MADQSSKRNAHDLYKAADRALKTYTGKNIKDSLKMGVNALIESLDSKMTEGEAPVIARGPLPKKLEMAYRVLHSLSTDDDRKIREWFRELIKIVHPEIGSKPDEVEFERVVFSYNLIMTSRHPAPKDEEECPKSSDEGSKQ